MLSGDVSPAMTVSWSCLFQSSLVSLLWKVLVAVARSSSGLSMGSLVLVCVPAVIHLPTPWAPFLARPEAQRHCLSVRRSVPKAAE